MTSASSQSASSHLRLSWIDQRHGESYYLSAVKFARKCGMPTLLSSRSRVFRIDVAPQSGWLSGIQPDPATQHHPREDTLYPSQYRSVASSTLALRKRELASLLLFFAIGIKILPSVSLPADMSSLPEVSEEYIRPPSRPDIPLNSFSIPDTFPGSYPEQVHVTLAGPNRMQVSWITRDETAPSIVYFGKEPSNLNRTATGSSENYTYLRWRSGQIHHTVLGSDDSLEDATSYYYKCGIDSPIFSFKTPPTVGPQSPLTIHVLGDLGQTGWSVSTLDHMMQKDHDLVLYAGDLSYADRFQPRWDTWGRLVQPLASCRPWLMVAGNHEFEDILGLEPPFKAYKARYKMPHEPSQSNSNFYYSVEAGSAHFVMLSSYSDSYVGSEQFRWLQRDLSLVDRAKTPWLVVVLHAPWYNSNRVHQGDGDEMKEAMEQLLHEARVDFLFSGHVHAYERSCPVYDGLPNLNGTIHITVGDGGNREGLASSYIDPCPVWSMKREASFGHGELTIYDEYSAKWEWHRNQDDEAVEADQVWSFKPKPFANMVDTISLNL